MAVESFAYSKEDIVRKLCNNESVNPVELRQQKLREVKMFLMTEMGKAEIFTHQNSQNSDAQPPKAKNPRLDPFADMDDICFSHDRSSKTSEQELSEYEALVVLDLNEEYRQNPLLFFKQNATQSPRMAKVVRKLFSAPATSCCSERNFSTTGRIYEKRRSRLIPNRVDAIMRTRGSLKNSFA